MTWRIPQVAAGVLHVLDLPGGPEIAVDSPTWVAWPRNPATRSFPLRDSTGTFTARKERRSGGDEYWTACRKRGGKLRKVYLGKAEKLTLARLEDAAADLAGRSEGEVTTADDAEPTRPDGAGRGLSEGRMATRGRTRARNHKATLAELGAELGITRERVRQVQRKAERDLRGLLAPELCRRRAS